MSYKISKANRAATIWCFLTALLLGCNSNSSQMTGGDAQQIPANAYDMRISVPVMNDLTGADTTEISATVFVPKHVEGQTYPLILQAHGGLGRRESTNRSGGEHVLDPGSYDFIMGDWVDELQDAGFAVLSWSARGYLEEDGTPGSEGSTQRISPDYDIPDAMGLIDWALDNLDIARDGGGDPLIGVMGGSDGGHMSLSLAAADPRVDAIAAAITAEDQTMIYPNNVLQKSWVTVFCGLLPTAGRMVLSDFMHQLCIDGADNAATRFKEEISANVTGIFDDHGFIHYIRRHQDPLDSYRMPVFDALLIQGHRDTLYDPGAAYRNYNFLTELGGDVRLHTNQRGHYVGPPVHNQPALGVYDCGPYETQAMTIAWFQAKLLGQPQSITNIPKICISLSDTDWVLLNTIPAADGTQKANLVNVEILPGQNNFAGEPAALASFVPVSQSLPNGDWLVVGTPIANLQIESSVPGVEAVAFVGTGIRNASGSVRFVDFQVTPIRSSTGAVDLALTSVAEALNAGDELGVLLWNDYDSYENANKSNFVGNAYTITGAVDFPVIQRP